MALADIFSFFNEPQLRIEFSLTGECGVSERTREHDAAVSLALVLACASAVRASTAVSASACACLATEGKRLSERQQRGEMHLDQELHVGDEPQVNASATLKHPMR